MGWKLVNNSDAGDATHHGGDSMDKISKLFSGIADVDTVDINSEFKVRSGKFSLADSDNSHKYIFDTENLSVDRRISVPLLLADDILVTQAFIQPLTGKTIDADLNSILNLVNANIKAGANISKSKIDITGVWSDTELPAEVVYNDLANSFVAGMRQSFQSDDEQAGFRLVPASVIPNNLLDGDFFYDSLANKIKVKQNGVVLDLISSVGNINLDDILDVDVPSPANNSVLKFNASTGKWEAGTDLVGSAIALSITAVNNANYTMLDSDDVLLVTTGNTTRTITLPNATTAAPKRRTIKKVDTGSGNVIIDGNGAQTVGGQPNITLYVGGANGQRLEFTAHGTTDWEVLL